MENRRQSVILPLEEILNARVTRPFVSSQDTFGVEALRKVAQL